MTPGDDEGENDATHDDLDKDDNVCRDVEALSKAKLSGGQRGHGTGRALAVRDVKTGRSANSAAGENLFKNCQYKACTREDTIGRHHCTWQNADIKKWQGHLRIFTPTSAAKAQSRGVPQRFASIPRNDLSETISSDTPSQQYPHR
jgi:hypothetical protein